MSGGIPLSYLRLRFGARAFAFFFAAGLRAAFFGAAAFFFAAVFIAAAG
jgi:hypothetical protein